MKRGRTESAIEIDEVESDDNDETDHIHPTDEGSATEKRRKNNSLLSRLFEEDPSDKRNVRCLLPSEGAGNYKHLPTVARSNRNRHLGAFHQGQLKLLETARDEGRLELALARIKQNQVESIQPFLVSGRDHSRAAQVLWMLKKSISWNSVADDFYSQIFSSLGLDTTVAVDRNFITRKAIPALTQIIAEKVKSLLSDSHEISISFDGWTDISMKKFLGVMLYFTSEKKWNLAVSKSPSGSHSQ